ncbi:NAD(P)/FAD-dependent oxidoreductase [Planctomycetota bacterium]|nr:NAD(P)/FAD-dependent oxidoreductase [Planctomycetota bacterium]
MSDFDVAIIGGGPGGSTLAALLANSGVRVVIVERSTFPRLAVGESLLPYSLPIWEKSGVLSKLEKTFLRKPGARFVNDDTLEEDWFLFDNTVRVGPDHAFNVRRADLDQLLLEHAVDCGAKVHQPDTAENVVFGDDDVLVQTSNGEFKTKYLVDATGRDTFLANRQKTKQLDTNHRKIAVFAHFEGVQRDEKHEGNIYIVRFHETARGWFWMIPFTGEVSSVGVVSDIEFFKNANQTPEQFLQAQLAASRFMGPRTQDMNRVTDVFSEAEFTYSGGALSGDRWLKLGDAGAFIDPIFSSGVLLSTLAAEAAYESITAALPENKALAGFDEPVEQAVRVFRTFINAFYDKDLLQHMVGPRKRPLIQRGITSLLAGDVFNQDNPLIGWLEAL